MALVKRSVDSTKAYWWRAANLGNGMGRWNYVTADAQLTVEADGYFTDEEIAGTAQVGDEVYVYQVAAVSDARTVQADMEAGLTAMTRHLVLVKTTAKIDISPALETTTVTYTS